MPTVFPTPTSPPPHESTMGIAAPSPPPPAPPLMSHKSSSSSLAPAPAAAAAAGSTSHQVGARQGTRSRTRTRQTQLPVGSNGAGPSRIPTTRYSTEDHPLSPHRLSAKGYHSFQCLGVPFHVKKRYTFMRELGIGAYGCVALAHDSLLDCNVAIKKVTRIFEREVLARRALREVAILREIGICDNVTALLDFDTAFVEFNEIYLVLEASEADLSQIIRSGQPLSDAHLQYFIAQILRGVRYMHAAKIIHRDMKPGNLLVNGDCQLKLCDFGLARAFRGPSGTVSPNDTDSPGAERSFPDSPHIDRSQPSSPSLQLTEQNLSKLRTTALDFPGGPLTEYVATRWYRAPEIMLCFRHGYGPAIDIWSVGCILAELLGGKPIFAGKDYVDQIARINNVLGSPPESTVKKIGSERARTYVESLPHMPAVPLSKLYPSVNPQAVDLLERMLCWDPEERITAAEALNHPWLKAYHRSNNNWTPPRPFDRFDEVEMLSSIADFRVGLEREADEMRAELEALEAEERRAAELSALRDVGQDTSAEGSANYSGGVKGSRHSHGMASSTGSPVITPSSLSSSVNGISPTYETDLTSVSAPHSVAGSHSAGKQSRIRAIDGLGLLSSTHTGANGTRDHGREALDKTLADHGLLRGDESELIKDRKATFRRRALSNAPSQASRLRRRGSEGSLLQLVKDASSKAACVHISGSGSATVKPQEDDQGAATAIHDALSCKTKTTDVIRRPTLQREEHNDVADEVPSLLAWLSIVSSPWCARRDWMRKDDGLERGGADGAHLLANDGSDTTVVGFQGVNSTAHSPGASPTGVPA